MIKEIFIECIRGMHKAKITYFSKKEQANTTRIVAPTDIVESTNKEGYSSELFWFYDFKSGHNGHMTPQKLEDIVSLEKLDENFSKEDLPKDVNEANRNIQREW